MEFNDMINQVIQGDCLTVLKTFPDESIDCCITSPPYWGLRDYGIDGQLGLEPTFNEYINKLIQIFNEVKRVLKKTGTCWVNLGDSYSGMKIGNTDLKNTKANSGSFIKQKQDLSDKSLCLIPQRFQIEMVNQGWICRNTIIWYKRNCMPSSVSDRFTVDFEYLFFFVKNKKYWFEQQFESSNDPESYKGRRKRNNMVSEYIKQTGHNNCSDVPEGKTYPNRNMRTVWDITTKSFKEAHFATFPEELPARCIKAGCPKEGIVLDPFAGAGTTLMVAKKLGRNYIGIELSQPYCKMAEERIKKECGELF